MARVLAVLALLLALTGCATPATLTPTGSAPTAQADTAGVVAAPVAVSIPAIGAHSTLIPLGLNPDGSLAVPPVTEPGQASWYMQGNYGVVPGAPGPALISGHVSGRQDGAPVPGVFARLHELGPGDEVIVDRDGADPLVFRVTVVETYDKDAFPWDRVAADTATPQLRLITCGGLLGEAPDGSRSYQSNVVAYAVLA